MPNWHMIKLFSKMKKYQIGMISAKSNFMMEKQIEKLEVERKYKIDDTDILIKEGLIRAMNDWLLEILKTKEDYYDKIIAKEA